MSENTISFGTIRVDQRELVENELAEADVECRIYFQPPGPGFFTGAVLVAIAFVTKPLFEAFLKEAGKDAYLWLKSKLAFKKASKRHGLTVAYRITIDGIVYYDRPKEYSESRHDGLILAIVAALNNMQEDCTRRKVSVYLEFDDQKAKYSRAIVFPVDRYELPPFVLQLDASFIKDALFVYNLDEVPEANKGS